MTRMAFIAFIAGFAFAITVVQAADDRAWWPWAIVSSVLLIVIVWIVGQDAMARLDQLKAGWQRDEADRLRIAAERRSFHDRSQQAMALANGKTSERAMYATGIAPLKYLGEK